MEQNEIEITEKYISDTNEYYSYTKAEFLEELEEYREQNEKNMLEIFTIDESSGERYKTVRDLDSVYIEFNYIDRGTRLAEWCRRQEKRFLTEMLQELVDDGKIETICDDDSSVLGYKTKK